MEKREQVAKQCDAVVHLAKALGQVYSDYAVIFRTPVAAGHDNRLVEPVGKRTAHLMEVLGDILNGMDAVDEKEDAWLDPIYAEAHRLWPQ